MIEPAIYVFSKPGCPHCDRVKAVLNEHELAFVERDVESSEFETALSVFLSGRTTVPQIFIGSHHIGGAEELAKLVEDGALSSIIESASGTSLQLDRDEEEVLRGAQDVSLGDFIKPVPVSETDDEEVWPVLRYYKTFFGFWPHCADYMALWPPAYKLFLYCHNVPAIRASQEILGAPVMSALAYATSKAHGCSYCQVHSASVGGEKSIQAVNLLRDAQNGVLHGAGPIGPFEAALGEIAAASSLGPVHAVLIEQARALHPQDRGPPGAFESKLTALGQLVGSFGYQNTFNDLTNVEIEGDWMRLAQTAGIEAGRHTVSATNPDNLGTSIPVGGPTMAEVEERYRERVGDYEGYCEEHFGFVPNWIEAYPHTNRPLEALQYATLMGPRAGGRISGELKHLMARVSAIARGHQYLAAFEAFQAHRKGDGDDRSIERIKSCYLAATSWAHNATVFAVDEVAALRLAWLSAQVPLVTPRRFIEPAIEAFAETDLVELLAVCACAAMTQRWCAVQNPQIDVTVKDFWDASVLSWAPL